MKKVFKYGTGQEVPEGAEYLSTVVQDEIEGVSGSGVMIKTWLVWHYFLVEINHAKH